ncbi:sugar transferase [uncultured Thomasclavelia sp.]|uniref:sugar transferase n=1 Tax=uncultured Thomasclavelia sp. TaxID=3025759 RepID=UPI002613D1CE|nr:sugar transferase [uncultured Thomasclavelia sp.]
MYYKYVKRLLDIFISLIGIIILSPLLLITAIFIKIDSKGPVIFKQKRLGRYGKEFEIYKFRSMIQNAEKQGSGQYSFKGDPRITRVGKIIRATSIDELPQFINILKGDMSIIGFRPPLTYHPKRISEYSEEQMRMFNVRPGVTGWAQIHGRKTVVWKERIEMNIWYVNNISFKLDLYILFMTVIKVIKNENNENTIITVGEDGKK